MFHTIFRSSISNAKPFTRALVLAFSATFISTPSQDAAASSAPYPQSGTITSVSWDFAHVTQTAFGSDIWPVTWASDDNLYTGWGDGIGFGAFDFNEQRSSPERASIGFSRISGGPTNFTAVNVWGGENRLNAATFCGKTGSMISVDGVLYCSVTSHFNNTSNNEFQCASNPSTPELRLAWSSDLSESWTQSTWKVVQNPGTFSFGAFLNFGKDNAGAFDSNVYLYGSKAGDVHNTYLARVPKTDLKDNPAQSTAYQYFAGLDGSGSPIWVSSDTQSKPIFTDPNGSSSFSVVYDAPLRRYLATEIHGPDFDTAGDAYPTKNFGLFEAPTPWGPWSTIAYYTDWGGYSAANPGEGGYIPTKWISSDGKTIWVIFSWPDAFNMVQGTLTVGASPAGSGMPPGTAHAINAGGGAAGSFSADTGYSGGYTYATSAWIDTSQVSSPAPQEVYQTERWFGDFSYTMSGLSAGSSYTVRLHFAEIFWSDSGWRLFNVAINDSEVLNSFDVFHEAGGANRGIVREFGTTADGNGQIRVSFSTILDAAKVSGIEILDAP